MHAYIHMSTELPVLLYTESPVTASNRLCMAEIVWQKSISAVVVIILCIFWTEDSCKLKICLCVCFLQALTHLWKWACPEAPLTQPMGASLNRCWLHVRLHQGNDRLWSSCRAPRTPIFSMFESRDHLQLILLLFSIPSEIIYSSCC